MARLVRSAHASGCGAAHGVGHLVIDRHPDGSTSTRFTPVGWQETRFYMDELVARTNTALRDNKTHPLLVIAMFVLDWRCIHPFADGNGRVARLPVHGHILEGFGAPWGS